VTKKNNSYSPPFSSLDKSNGIYFCLRLFLVALGNIFFGGIQWEIEGTSFLKKNA
jgi:hypothetical protein